MLVVGITGGVASGKSTATRILAELGAVAFSADEAARAVLTPGGPIEREVVAAFGSAILDVHSHIDRRRLADLAFSDPEHTETLNRVLHPPIRRLLLAQIDAVRNDFPPATIVVVEVPLLYEGNMQSWFDLIAVVTTSQPLQVKRMRDLRGMGGEEANRLLAAQWPLASKVALATEVVANDGSISDLRASLASLWNQLRNNQRRAPESVCVERH